MIMTTYSLCQSANFEQHHQPEVDPRILSPIRRPTSSLLDVSNANFLGELSRFSEIFHTIISPKHHDDIKKTILIQLNKFERFHDHPAVLVTILQIQLKSLKL